MAIAGWRVRVVTPCFNRRADLAALLGDLSQVDLGADGARIDLSVVVVDNASTEPLGEVDPPPGLRVEHLRLDRNSGGSGGFNAGLGRVLSRGIAGDRSELVWLLDSDARLEPGVLVPLIAALENDPGVCAAGSAIVDPETGEVFEVGGHVNRRTGMLEPALRVAPRDLGPIPVDYVAACSALVRRTAIERTGLLPDVFLNGDDARWFIEMRRSQGGGPGGGVVVAVPASRVRHPRFDRFAGWTRYYSTRNALGPIDALGLARRVRLARGLRSAGRAAMLVRMERDDLGALTLDGLRDGLRGRIAGARGDVPGRAEPFHPFGGLGRDLADRLGGRAGRATLRVHPCLEIGGPAEATLAAQLQTAGLSPSRRPDIDDAGWERPRARRWLRGLGRLLLGPEADVAIVPAHCGPEGWRPGRMSVHVTPGGYVIRGSPVEGGLKGVGLLVRAAGALARGSALAARLALRPRGEFAPPLPAAPRPPPSVASGVRALTLGVVIVSHNRWAALRETLARVRALPEIGTAGLVVVDNDSTDGTPERLREEFGTGERPVRLIEMGANAGIAAFGAGVRALDSDVVLVLDDDAWPDRGILAAALELLATRPDLAAVALHPRHPATGASEWPFARTLEESRATSDRWPVMGCANLIRRDAWERAGGYDDSFFLYRNDTDLAMKLAAMGLGVHFNPAWVAWHASPAAAVKSPRWLELATRNWVWLCRRHGRGWSRIVGIIGGCVRASGHAGWSIARQARVGRGIVAGLARPPRPMPAGLRSDGRGLRELLRLRRTRARPRDTVRPE